MLLDKRISIADFIKIIRFDIGLISAYAIIVGFLDQYEFLNKVNVPLSVTGVFGTAVALLLGFRTSQSYERWWEARIIWGSIVNDSRTLVRQALAFYNISEDQQRQEVSAMAERQIIWCYALGEALRKLPFSQRVQTYLRERKIEDRNLPNAILSVHSQAVAKAHRDGWINDLQQVQIDSTLARLCEAMGRCERIKNTVFPKAHSLLIHFIIYVFATMLPFGLSDEFLLVEITLTIGVPVIFIAIEKTAILMENPFENKPMDTPMTDLAQTIEINLKEMTSATDVPVKKQADSYFIL
jgi:putative membrane protein